MFVMLCLWFGNGVLWLVMNLQWCCLGLLWNLMRCYAFVKSWYRLQWFAGICYDLVWCVMIRKYFPWVATIRDVFAISVIWIRYDLLWCVSMCVMMWHDFASDCYWLILICNDCFRFAMSLLLSLMLVLEWVAMVCNDVLWFAMVWYGLYAYLWWICLIWLAMRVLWFCYELLRFVMLLMYGLRYVLICGVLILLLFAIRC